MTPERIAELRTVLDADLLDQGTAFYMACDDLPSALDTIEAQQRRIEELEAALKPFASDELHEGLDDGPDDKMTTWPSFRLGELRAARSALQPKEPS